MNARYYEELSTSIEHFKSYISKGKELFLKIKDLEGIKYIEELTKNKLDLLHSYGENFVIFITDLSPEIMCSVAAEIEIALDCESEVETDINEEKVKYFFPYLVIIIGNPRCEWLTDEEIIEYYKPTEIKSKKRKGRLVCM